MSLLLRQKKEMFSSLASALAFHYLCRGGLFGGAGGYLRVLPGCDRLPG